MKRALGFLLLLCTGIPGIAQHTLTALIKDASTKEPLPGTTGLLAGTAKGAKADSNGLVTLSHIPDGRQELTFHFVGYKDHTETLTFPRNPDTLNILLERVGEVMDQVVISSTRSNRSIQNLATRVEFINGEELEEKGNMKPGDIPSIQRI